MFFISDAIAHGGGLDSSGGHNCYVGSCAGSYHYHRGSGKPSNDNGDIFGGIFILVFLLAMLYPFIKNIPKAVVPELRTPSEKRYWDALKAKEKAEHSYEQQAEITAKIGADYSQDDTAVTEAEWLEARNKLEVAQKLLTDATVEYEEALRLVHIDEEKRKREKRIKRFK